MTSPPDAQDFPHWTRIPTRWLDNDIYGHVNNAVHYQVMDTVINEWLIGTAHLDIHSGEVIGLCVSSRCDYYAPISYPDAFRVGLRVERLGRSSVTWQVGMYAESDGTAVALGEFTHVFVDRGTRRPLPPPRPTRAALEDLTARSGVTFAHEGAE